MTKLLDTARLRLNAATWAQESTAPNAGGGNAAAVGSLWQRAATLPATPVELYLKLNTANTGWVHQNLVNLNIFNVKTFGAVGNGVTNDLTAIRAAVAAAAAAGGGIVYFPATPNFYSCVATAGNTSLIDLAGLSNIVLLGDGYASKIKQTGSAGGGDTRLIGISNSSSRIRIYNLYLDCANITSSNEHSCTIQFFSTSGSAPPGPSDCEIVGVYFGRAVGDGIRCLGAASNKLADNLRVSYCSFNMRDGNVAGSRAAISAQRDTSNVNFQYNYLIGSHDQQIDFEPTSNEAGPEGWLMLGNHIDHETQNVNCVTLSGSGNTALNESKHNLFAYNTITNGGDVSGLKMRDTTIKGNIIMMNNTITLSVMEFFEVAMNMLITSNIAKSLVAPTADPFARAALASRNQNSAGASIWCVTNNIFFSNDGAGATAPLVVGLNDVITAMFAGNMMTMDTNFGTTGIIFVNDAISSNLKAQTVVGNMAFRTGTNAARAGFRFSASTVAPAKHLNNGLFIHNWVAGGSISDGFRWTTITDDWKGGHQNVAVGVTNLLNTTQATLEGPNGPGSQITMANSAAGPEGAVDAPIGSLATNLVGGNSNVLAWKESGTGGTPGNTGWFRVGGQDVAMGALSGSVATAARFFAPGGLDLAAESTVEIQWTAPRAGLIRNLRLHCTAGTGGNLNTYTVRKNGVNTTLTFGVNNVGSSASDTTHSFTVAAGDLISIQVAKDVAPVTPQTNIVLVVEII